LAGLIAAVLYLCLSPAWAAPEQLYFVAANTTHAALQVREVRHALAMGIDRDALVKSVKISGAVPAYAVVPPAAYGATAHGSAPYAALRPDMRAAIADVLLAEQKIDAAHPAMLSLIYLEGDTQHAIAAALVAAWKAMNVHVQAQALPAADYAQHLRDGSFDLALAESAAGDAHPLAYLTPFLPGNPANITRYAEADFAERMQAAEAAQDPAHHLILLADAEAVVIEDHPVLPLFFFTPP
jgi:oligopeptide transport system substrate-binding protein